MSEILITPCHLRAPWAQPFTLPQLPHQRHLLQMNLPRASPLRGVRGTCLAEVRCLAVWSSCLCLLWSSVCWMSTFFVLLQEVSMAAWEEVFHQAWWGRVEDSGHQGNITRGLGLTIDSDCWLLVLIGEVVVGVAGEWLTIVTLMPRRRPTEGTVRQTKTTH